MRLNDVNRISQSELVFDANGEPRKLEMPLGDPLKITIVTPSFNQGEFLEACIDSVLSQGYPNLEYIVMDGGSTDNSVEIIRKYEKYLAYWQSKPDGGQYAAINEGFCRSSGEVMAWINSDDRYWPGAFDTVARVFSSCEDVEWLTGRGSVIDVAGDIIGIEQLRSLTISDYLDPKRKYFLQQESTFWKSSLWQRAGGKIDASLALAGDFELWQKFFRHAPLHVVDKVLAGFRQHDGQKTDVNLAGYFDEIAVLVADERQRLGLPKDIVNSPSRIELVTSLIPKDDDNQRLAIRSWIKLGFFVTSFNPEEELDFLRQTYPEVNLVKAPRDGRHHVGKPCVYVDDILKYLKSSSADVFGIINADIHLSADDTILDFLCKEAKGAMVYGSRLEVDSPHSATGWEYWLGYDYFFFDRGLLDFYPKTEFMLGVPWWDYWLPLLPALKGYPLKRLDAPIAYHVSHPVNYDNAQLIDFGAHTAELIKGSKPELINREHIAQLLHRYPGKNPNPIAMLTVASRYAIRSGSTSLKWESLRLNLLRNAIVDIAPGEFRVTAMVSTYASEAFIGECLADLVNQTIAKDVEIIVVDAASPENERAIVESFQERYPNIRYIRTDERIGVYAAWNLICREARGCYLVSCSTNDRLARDSLEIMARTLDERPEFGIVYGSTYLTRVPHQTVDDFDYGGAYIWPVEASFELLLTQPGIGPHPMWRRSLHDEFGYFDERYTAIADQDFWLRVSRKRQCFNMLDVTGLYWVSDDSLSGNQHLAQAEYREIHEGHARAYRYQQLVKARIFHKALGRFYENRIPEWRSRFLFEIMVVDDGQDPSGLVATIQSLTGQYYENIHLSILSGVPQPEGVVGERISWAHTPGGDWAQAFNVMLEHGNADWVCVIRAGDLVAPHAFLLIGEHIHQHPEWKLLYTDEDVLDPVEGRCNPSLKPDADIDLLRNSWYMGNLLLMERNFLKSLGGARLVDLNASLYELALHTCELTGNAGVGHVPDILYHRRDTASQLSMEAGSFVVREHLQRIQAQARVERGMLADGWRVVFLRDHDPLVSVMLLFEGNIGQLERALVGFLQSTGYQSTDLIVVDRGGADAQTREFIAGIGQLDHQRIRIYDGRHDATMAEALNLAAGMARGEYLMFFDASLAVVHQDWLDVLLSHALRHEVGIVGPRSVYSDGQLHGTWSVLGLMGPAGDPYCGVTMEHPGYLNRLLLEQGVSAISSECFLIRTNLFAELGGLNSVYSSSELWALDLFLRCRGNGKSIIWTPYSTLLASGDACALEDQDTLAREEGFVKEDQDQFFRQWIDTLDFDASYNPCLSRNERGMGVEASSLIGWNITPWKPVPTVLAHIADFDGCGNYRVLQPLDGLMRAGRMHGEISTSYHSPPELAACKPDTVIFQRVLKQKGVDAIKRYASFGGAKIVLEIDDLITEIAQKNISHTLFTARDLACFRNAIRESDRLVVSTEPLALAYRNLASETVVMPNCLAAHLWSDLKPSRRRSAKPRVGWAGGISHTGDLEMVADVVMALADEIDWVFLGMCPPELRAYVREFHRGTPFSDYPAKLASLNLDLAIAPLEVNAFNEAKSHLKLLEYGILGYPVICTDVVPYQGAYPVTRVKNHRDVWIRSIRERVRDLDACAREGDMLREYVLGHWMLEDHLDEWVGAWLS